MSDSPLSTRVAEALQNLVYRIKNIIPTQSETVAGKYLKTDGEKLVWGDIEGVSITFDDTPTEGSNNAVTSQGIKRAIDAKDSLPEQTGNNGKVLSTNGTTASWETIDAGEDFSQSITDVFGGELFKNADNESY